MNALTRLAHLPLLVKELLEQAARPRTYWNRVAYGALLYLIVVVPQARFFKGNAGNGMGMLGAGRDLFEMLVLFQFAGIFVFLPALMCGRIAHEKERDSLVLLLLTALSPTQIVLQKYVAGLVPMLTFLLLGLPLAAVAYAFGGFPPRDLALAAATLLLTCLQLGALALWCSALCRNTAGAFIATYALGILFYLGPVGGAALINEFCPGNPIPNAEPFILHIPPAVFVLTTNATWKVGSLRLGLGVGLGTTLLFLALATYHLPRRAFAPPARLGKRLFAWLDSVLQTVNRLFGNIVIGRPAAVLPDDRPVLWRERRSRLLGRPAYLARLLVAVEVPVILLVRYLGTSQGNGYAYDDEQIGLSVCAAGFGTLSILALAVTAANTFVVERVNQTLEVLLTTPLAAREIVRQKARALRGLQWVVAVPLLTIFVYEAVLEYAGRNGSIRADKDSSWAYIVCAMLTVAVYLPLVNWLALWIGLANRTRLRSIVVTICAILGWCALPYLVLGGILDVDLSGSDSWLYFASPLTVPAANEISSLHEYARASPWIPVLVNFTLYGIVVYTIRNHCLAHADEYLRR